MKTSVIIDVNNALFWESYRTKNMDEYLLAQGFILNTIGNIQSLFGNVDNVILGFESGSNWRKLYSRDNNMIKLYKGNRDRYRDNGLKEMVYRAADVLRNVIKNTKLHMVQLTEFEGDDVIAESAIYLAKNGHKIIIMSTDNDFKQLMRFGDVSIYDIDTKTYKECDDPHYFIFHKIIRGDQGDNVACAYPRIRDDRIVTAYTNPDEYNAILEHTFKHPLTGDQLIVKEVIEHNKRIMDLTYQPPQLREKLETYIANTLTYDSGFINSLHVRKIVAMLNTYKKNVGIDILSKIVDDSIEITDSVKVEVYED